MAERTTTGAVARVPAIEAIALIAALAVPAVLVGNALLVLLQPWLVHLQYALPGFPDDAFGLSGSERTDLAVTGVRSISPWNGDGIALLRDSRLPQGGPAFDAREQAHMADVRAVTRGFTIAWAAGNAVLALAAVVLARAGRLGELARGLRWGALLTFACFGVTALVMVADFDAFFTAFHGIFFEGDSWRFVSQDTLLRLYPDAFWSVAGALIAALVLVQAGVILWAAARLSRGAGLRRAR